MFVGIAIFSRFPTFRLWLVEGIPFGIGRGHIRDVMSVMRRCPVFGKRQAMYGSGTAGRVVLGDKCTTPYSVASVPFPPLAGFFAR